MGMSIEEAKPKIQFVRNGLNDDWEIAKAYDVAIDTMRKYQKIQEIVNHWNNTGGSAEESDILDYIEEVVKDGKID